MAVKEIYSALPQSVRILIIVVLAVLAHLLVRWIRFFSQRLLNLKVGNDTEAIEIFAREYPRYATLITILVSALTFAIYFLAVGLILKEFEISLSTYLASATVIGLAIGFGLQGFVQDVVIGLTLIFSDLLNIGEVVEISGQIGRVESIGLRFSTIVNFHGQKIHIPNRNIAIISRYRKGAIRAYADIQLPDGTDHTEIVDRIQEIATAMYRQHQLIILSQPENFGIKQPREGVWYYVRIKFRIWPGQNSIIETTFKQRVVAYMKKSYPDYADWMVVITYRVE
ncbi:MAG: mechanosensitive ion channel domain-containing protein [Calditrichia bacterium]